MASTGVCKADPMSSRWLTILLLCTMLSVFATCSILTDSTQRTGQRNELLSVSARSPEPPQAFGFNCLRLALETFGRSHVDDALALLVRDLLRMLLIAKVAVVGV